MRIQHKIVIPFTLLFAFLILAAALLSISIFSRSMEREAGDRLRHVANALSESGFILDAGFLSSVKQVVQVDFIISTGEGRVLTTTLPPGASEKIIEKLQRGAEGIVSIEGSDYRYISHPLHNPMMPSVSAITVLTSAEKLRKARTEFSKTVALLSLIAIFLVGVVGYGISLNITRPLQNLVQGTKRLAAGDLNVSVSRVSPDEVGALTQAFNEMTERLKVSEKRLIESEKQATVSHLAASVAHEIRNPLSSIKLLVQLIGQRESQDDMIRMQVQAILGEIDRMDLIIGGLLDLGRPMELHRSPQDLNAIIKDVLFIMDAQFRHHKIEVVRGLDDHLSRLNIDPDRIKQVVFNLVLNAMDAMPNGGRLQVFTKRSGTGARIEIGDSGQGMSFEDTEKAFAPFVTTKKSGIGMGLPLSRSIIETHGGVLKLVSGGEGTRAIIDLPKEGGIV
ncbi:MAG TPA: ATP-binding protein [Nitrospirota bacterium]|nr:ATP-binding protein [Nitrospirota bacterium]